VRDVPGSTCLARPSGKKSAKMVLLIGGSRDDPEDVYSFIVNRTNESGEKEALLGNTKSDSRQKIDHSCLSDEDQGRVRASEE
jgi:hypothetical protein